MPTGDHPYPIHFRDYGDTRSAHWTTPTGADPAVLAEWLDALKTALRPPVTGVTIPPIEEPQSRFVGTERVATIRLIVTVPTMGKADQDASTAREVARSLYHSVGGGLTVSLVDADATIHLDGMVDVTHRPKANLPEVVDATPESQAY